MSVATRRAEIAADITDQIDGVTIRPYRSRSVKSLNGWMILQSVQRGATFHEVEVTFDVLVPLGTDLEACEKAIDLLSEPILTACAANGGDVSLKPYEIQFEAATYFCVVATFTTESEIG